MLLDASALLAYLTNEPGTDEVRAVLLEGPCWISSVTLTEAEGKLVGRGDFTHGQVQDKYSALLALVREEPFDSVCRARAAFYYARKSAYNLSLGDAACLGTAEALGLDVLTAERGWAKVPDLPFKVHLIR
ncbi:PIN domain nuclease, a component of toxin-antitoxin system (PIN domain) [Deinococcus reticulitermitis]|uniref:PIN domain nuclease, a component of toxin-antitoxin system (PIN domain) n=1 Tax=Deinococcus reticulitermitis TaxID=856736 RepID=A0A1H6UGC2_9DEIO|nr:PIN domain-containing protein [Deinococcus reticulitermitis]SEI91381.1 PIN domain nuclease, a component of toxin-antitoxin system (PIN domain) [Deinococcus reticulitermitis]